MNDWKTPGRARAPREASQAGLFQETDHLRQGKPRNPGEVVDLHGGERLDVHLRETLPQGSEHAEIEVERQIRVEPPPDVQLRRVLGTPLLRTHEDLVHGHGVGERLFLPLAERAELAPVDADIGGVDVPVDDEVHTIAVHAPVGQVRHLPYRVDVPRAEQGKGVLLGHPHPRRHLIPNPHINVPPVADAGSDQEVTDNDDNGSETVTLDGSASSDSDGPLTSWGWRGGASEDGTG